MLKGWHITQEKKPQERAWTVLVNFMARCHERSIIVQLRLSFSAPRTKSKTLHLSLYITFSPPPSESMQWFARVNVLLQSSAYETVFEAHLGRRQQLDVSVLAPASDGNRAPWGRLPQWESSWPLWRCSQATLTGIRLQPWIRMLSWTRTSFVQTTQVLCTFCFPKHLNSKSTRL